MKIEKNILKKRETKLLNMQNISYFNNLVRLNSKKIIDLHENNNNNNSTKINKEFLKKESFENRKFNIKLKKAVINTNEIKRESIKSYRKLLKRKETNQFLKDVKIIDKE